MKTHKLTAYIFEYGTAIILVDTEENCDEHLKNMEQIPDFDYCVISLSKQTHKYKVFDTNTDTDCFCGSEFDCYQYIDEQDIYEDLKVVLMSEEEQEFFINLSETKEQVEKMIPTHKVLDMMYHEDEGQDCFCGSEFDCSEFFSKQGTIAAFTMKIVPLSKSEKNAYRDIEKEIVGKIEINEKMEKSKQQRMQEKFKKVLAAEDFDTYWYMNMKCNLPPFSYFRRKRNAYLIGDECIVNSKSDS